MSFALEMKGITKKFPRVIANHRVNFSVEKGEIHALIGENGAGKSTLMKILYGLQAADEGTIAINGRLTKIAETHDAIAQGIGMVHQHFMLIPTLTVLENIFLGMEPRGCGFLSPRRAKDEIAALSETYGLHVDVDARIEHLPVGLQQRVEIIKVLYRGAEILILDEPTAILTPQEVDDFFKIILGLKHQGKTVILITHKLQEVMSVADRVTVMRQGEVIQGGIKKDEATKEKLAELMVGRPVLFQLEKKERRPGKPVLEIKNVSARSSKHLTVLKNVSLSISAGEIVGIAGVEGNGQTELIEVVTGLRKVSSGNILLCGRDMTNGTPKKIFESHVGSIPSAESALSHIPEDRQRHGLIMDYSVEENLILGRHAQVPFAGRVRMHFRAIEAFAREMVRDYDIRPPNVKVTVRTLSGGNQQKLVVARELSRNPTLLVAAKLTRGVDIGAIEFIHKKILEARERGVAVLLVSSELSEIISLSDRIAVMYGGEIVGMVESGAVTEASLGLLMTGASRANAC